MQYKIYTLQHQRLYDQIHGIKGDEKVSRIASKEIPYLLDRCKELRRDFSAFTRAGDFDALFTDVTVSNKKTMYSFEHIVVKGNRVFVLERKKHYDNQRQLLKEKASYLRKALGKDTKVEFYILVDNNSTKNNSIKMEKFVEFAKLPKETSSIPTKVNEFVIKRHESIDITQYIQKKYNVDVTKKEVKRASGWVDIFKLTSPIVSKYKGNLSFLSSCIVFFYIMTAIFAYSIFAEEMQFILTIILDIIFLFFLINILKEIESKLPRWLKNITLLGTLVAFMFLFSRIIYYY